MFLSFLRPALVNASVDFVKLLYERSGGNIIKLNVPEKGEIFYFPQVMLQRQVTYLHIVLTSDIDNIWTKQYGSLPTLEYKYIN
jgi:hypothetical protein